MAEDSISEPSQPAAGRFQFRLRSIFILMAIVAFAFGMVPLWYQSVIVPAFLPEYLGRRFSFDQDGKWIESRRLAELQNAYRFTPGFSLIALVGCCGVWYGYSRPTERKSDSTLGLLFALPLGFVLFPPLGFIPYCISMWLVLAPFGVSPEELEQYSLPGVVSLAIIFLIWPLRIRRYTAAFVLFLYRCCHGWFVMRYAIEIVAKTITDH